MPYTFNEAPAILRGGVLSVAGLVIAIGVTVPYPGLVWEDDPPPPEPTPEQIQARFSTAIQARLDAFARTRLYDGILSACTYTASTDPKFAAEGQRCVELRDRTWAAAHNILNAVLTGNRSVPTIEEVFAELPALNWPD